MIFGVSRESPTEKIKDFMKKLGELKRHMGWMHKVRSFPPSMFITDHRTHIQILLLFVTLVINAFIIVCWEADSDYGEKTPVVQYWFPYVIYVLGGIHIFLSLLTVIVHFLTNPPFDYNKVCLFIFFSLFFFLWVIPLLTPLLPKQLAKTFKAKGQVDEPEEEEETINEGSKKMAVQAPRVHMVRLTSSPSLLTGHPLQPTPAPEDAKNTQATQPVKSATPAPATQQKKKGGLFGHKKE